MPRAERAAPDALLGDRYLLLGRIGAGGMGTVWEAEDRELGRRVAVKVLSEAVASDQRGRRRFRREARAAARLSHPNIAGIYDYREDDGAPFIVMELVEGETLARRLARQGRLPPDEALRVAGEIAEALEAAHRAGVVHRDVKPGNVMLTPEGDVKVLDFGIAAAAGDTTLTTTGTALGTAAYISPEQAQGLRATPASDVYSLGAVLYEMVAGRPPFTGDSPVAVAAAHLSADPPPLRDLAPHAPPALCRAVEAALAKDPAARPPSPTALVAMARGHMPTRRPAGGWAHRSPPPARGPDRPPPPVVGPDRPPLPTTGPAPEPTLTLPAAEAPDPERTQVLPAPPPRPAAAERRRGSVGLAPRGKRSRVRLALAALAGLAALALILSLVLPRALRQAPPPAGAKVEVPAVAGLPVAEARARLERARLQVAAITPLEGYPPGVAIRTDPPAGASLSPGSSVTLFVGAAPSPLPQPREGKGREHEPGKGPGRKKGGGDD